MEKLWKVLLALAVALTCLLTLPTTAQADTEGDYTYSVSNGKATITDYTGSGDNVTIPSTLGGYPVTTIGEFAFAGCNSLTSITIPDSVTSIGSYAFGSCYNLTAVTIPDSVLSIGNDAFSNCVSLTSVTIPDSVLSIGNDAFLSCYSLTGIWVDVNNTVYSSDDRGVLFDKDKTTLIQAPGAISGAYTIPDSVTSIGNSAFCWYGGLTSVTIGNSVTTIGEEAFAHCTSLTSVTIGDSVTTIGDYAFAYCDSLTSITIPDSVTTIGEEAFAHCTSLTSVTIPDSVLSIGEYAFYSCNSLTSVTIPDSVTSIGGYAFHDCHSLEYNVYDNAKYLGNETNPYLVLVSAVSDQITSCDIHKNTKIICCPAFRDCDSLTSVTIGDSVLSIGEYAFDGCGQLKNVYITDASAWCNIEFGDYYANPLYYGANLHILDENGREATEIVLDGTVTEIPYEAFYRCTSLTSVTIGDSVTTIGKEAFYNCVSLMSVTIPDSVTSIGSYAFYGCNSLKNVYFTGMEQLWKKINIGANNEKLSQVEYNHRHNYTLLDPVIVAATCETVGYTEYTCAMGEKYRSEHVPALGHDYSIKGITVQPTCVNQGYTEYKCIRCDRTEKRDWVDALGHDCTGPEKTIEPTCTTSGSFGHTCTRCGDYQAEQILEALGHNMVKVEAKEPTCTEAGNGVGTQCSRCQVYGVQPEVYPALEHIEVIDSAVAATCTNSGLTEGKHCSRCSQVLIAQEVENPLGHYVLQGGKEMVDSYTTQNDATYPFALSNGWYTSSNKNDSTTSTYTISAIYDCTLVLKYKVSSESNYDKLQILVNSTTKDTISGSVSEKTLTLTLKAGDRVYIKYAKDGSESSGADTGYFKINSCTQTEIDSTVRVPTDDIEPTCTQSIVCSDCKQTIKVATGHSHIAVVTAPTCLNKGYTTYTCHCGDTYVTDQVNALDHSFTNYKSNNNATCTEDGTETAKCDRCEETHTRTEQGSATGHSHNAVVTAPTCLDKGYTTHTCHCGDTYVDTYVDALDHSFTKYKSNNDATCTEDGTETAKCDRCVETHTRPAEGSATGHSYTKKVTNPTCTAKGYTTYTCHCGDTYKADKVDALEHSFTKYKSNNDATCTEDGTETAKCDRCTETHTRPAEGSATGHSYTKKVTNPTCTAKGYTTYTCHCGDTYKADKVDALNHCFTNYKSNNDATCTEDGTETAKCDRCVETHTRTAEDSATGHSYTKKVTNPTCTAKGYTTYTCQCGDTYKADYVKAKGHSYAKKVTNPTCTAKGYTTYTCRCGDTYKADYVKAKGHSYSNACDTSCNRSGCKTTRKITHNYAAATCTKAKTCKVCGKTDGKALGHSYKSGSCTRCKYKPAGAKITTQPTNVAVKNKKTATVTVKATGTGLKYTWYYAKKGAKTFTKTNVTTNTYSVKMSNSVNGGKVYCEVTDQYGNAVKSSTATLYKGTPAKIKTQPKSITVASGKTGKLTIKASGSSLKYQWYIKYKGASSFVKVGKSSKTYSFKMTDKMDGMQVYCVVRDKYGIEVKSAVVTVKAAPKAKIVTQPKNVAVTNGTKAKVTVKATGDGLKYTWYYAKKGSTKFKKASGKTATYSVKMSKSVDGYRVYCLVKDKYGNSVKSNVVTLTKK